MIGINEATDRPASMDSAGIIGNYEDHLVIDLRLSRLTVEVYMSEILRLREYLDGHGHNILKASSRQLIDFVLWRNSSGLNHGTTKKIMSALRSFYGFLVDEQVRNDDPARIIEIPKTSRHLPSVFTTGDIDALLSVIPVDTPLGIRDRALFELIYSCGLRITEACSISVSQVFLKESLLRVVGKRDRERVVPMGGEAMRWMTSYLSEARAKLLRAARPVEAVFISSRGCMLTRQGAWKKFRSYALQAGIEGKVHTLRHSYATHLLRGGADLRVVQELLGHKDISTTQIYTHVSDRELHQDHRKFHPGNRK